MTLRRVEWSNPARPEPDRIVAILCDDHVRSLVTTLRRLRLGARGRELTSAQASCDQCRGRDRSAAA